MGVKMNCLYVKNHKYLLPIQLKQLIKEKGKSLFCVESQGSRKLAIGGEFVINPSQGEEVVSMFPIITPEQLGADGFKKTYNTHYAYYAGAMANGISSVKMLVALGRKGFMGSLGTGGMDLIQLENCIDELQRELKEGPYLINLLCSPNRPELENKTVEILIKKRIKAIEASAFINISEALVYYRITGLSSGSNGEVISDHHIIAKVSREEVAMKFMSPAPAEIVKKLFYDGKITSEQVKLSANIPMADDITVEADSGGHTDNRPLVSLFPAILFLNDQMQEKNKFKNKVRIGAGGGISTPQAALAAFQMGAAFVVTGSVNQSCIEAGTSDHVKKILGNVRMQDVVMAPCADMFELGAKVQVIKRETMFPMNAQKLYQLYTQYNSLAQIPEEQRIQLEKRLFHDTLDNIWKQTEEYFAKVDPMQNIRANSNEKYKMALVFRWYLGQSAKWAIKGDLSHAMDMQIWCGQAMGAFNNWVNGTKYEEISNRKVAEIADLIMSSTAYLVNIQNGISAGIDEKNLMEIPV